MKVFKKKVPNNTNTWHIWEIKKLPIPSPVWYVQKLIPVLGQLLVFLNNWPGWGIKVVFENLDLSEFEFHCQSNPIFWYIFGNKLPVMHKGQFSNTHLETH
jgi:hypothetical protein